MTAPEVVRWDVVATTSDRYGNRQTWRMAARPSACDAAMVERRALARHATKFGVMDAALISSVWEKRDV